MGGRRDDNYPEHLNPFREDGDGDEVKINKLTALGRRKLRALLDLTSRTLFPWRKSKVADKDSSFRPRFLTMTPKLSRHILVRLSKRKPRSSSLAPPSNPATSTSQSVSYTEFRIMPKSSREKFSASSSREKREEALEGSYLWADRSSAPDLTVSSTSTSPLSEVCREDELPSRYTRQGAKPRKKRVAPPPPPQTDQKHAEMKETSASLTPSPLSKDTNVSLHESPPATPSLTVNPTTCVIVHETTISAMVHVSSDPSHDPPPSPCGGLNKITTFNTMTESEDAKAMSEDANTVSEASKTVSEDANTVLEDANTVSEASKTVPEDVNTLLEDANTVLEDANTVLDDANTVLDDAKVMLEDANTVLEDVKTVPEDAKTVLEDVKTVPEDAKTVSEDAKDASEQKERSLKTPSHSTPSEDKAHQETTPTTCKL